MRWLHRHRWSWLGTTRTAGECVRIEHCRCGASRRFGFTDTNGIRFVYEGSAYQHPRLGVMVNGGRR